MWQPTFKMASNGPLSLWFYSFVPLPSTPHRIGLAYVTNRILQKLWGMTSKVRPETCRFCPWSTFFQEVSCHVVKTLRFTRRITKASCNSQHQLDSHMSEPSWKWILQHYESLQRTAVMANTKFANSWETLNQEHPAKSLPNSLPTGTVWDNKFSVLF